MSPAVKTQFYAIAAAFVVPIGLGSLVSAVAGLYWTVPPLIYLAMTVFPLGVALTIYGLWGLWRMREGTTEYETFSGKLTADFGIMTGPLAIACSIGYVVIWYYRG